ncbi:MAG: polysaccharide deacetylase, partial [Ruminococcus sp.]|nr:polysaccharide deacetylase [Ruminococcus sp.]
MAKNIQLAALMSAAIILASCGTTSGERGNTGESVPPSMSSAAKPVQGQPLSTEKQGYGQGVQLDGNNRPLGALEFNAKYGKYNAKAISEDNKKITLTF